MSVTNRDLCLAIYEISDRAALIPRTLEEYLSALWKLARNYQFCGFLSPGLFIDLLDASLTEEPLDFEESWRATYRSEQEIDALHGYLYFQATIQNQIVDLRGFVETGGVLFDLYDMRDSKYWENVLVSPFLSNGACGKFKYWNVPDAVVPLEPLTWEIFADFLVYGQIYE